MARTPSRHCRLSCDHEDASASTRSGSSSFFTPSQHHAGLVHAPITVLHLVGLGAGGQSEELVAEADAEDGDVLGDRPLQRFNCFFALRGVARSIGTEEAVPLEVRPV